MEYFRVPFASPLEKNEIMGAVSPTSVLLWTSLTYTGPLQLLLQLFLKISDMYLEPNHKNLYYREEYQYSSCNSYLQTLFSKLNQMQAILMMKRFHLRIKVCKYKHPHYRQDQPYSICKITSHLKPLYFSIYPFQKIMMTKRHSQSIKCILRSITFSNLMNTYCRV